MLARRIKRQGAMLVVSVVLIWPLWGVPSLDMTGTPQLSPSDRVQRDLVKVLNRFADFIEGK